MGDDGKVLLRHKHKYRTWRIHVPAPALQSRHWRDCSFIAVELPCWRELSLLGLDKITGTA